MEKMRHYITYNITSGIEFLRTRSETIPAINASKKSLHVLLLINITCHHRCHRVTVLLIIITCHCLRQIPGSSCGLFRPRLRCLGCTHSDSKITFNISIEVILTMDKIGGSNNRLLFLIVELGD